MAELPSGTVTFLFTDIEASTALVTMLRQRYDEVLAEHRSLLRTACAAHGGIEVDAQGDAAFMAFPLARDAVGAAIAAQRAIAAHPWPDGAQVRVRMGLHTGEPHLSEHGYTGLGVHRAARICSAGHGGQVLLSRATAGILDDEEMPDVAVRDLGEHRLKDFDRPERIFQLVIDGLLADFAPLRTIDQQPSLKGTVIVVFTDLRGARHLVRNVTPEEFGALLGDYHRRLRRVFETAGATRVETTFDSVAAVFTTAKQAAAGAVSAQRAVASYPWPHGLRPTLSVGLHAGEAGVGWLGPAVNRAAALCDAAQGGQILLSEAVSNLLEDEELGALRLRNVGQRRVRGVEHSVRVYELSAPEAESHMPRAPGAR